MTRRAGADGADIIYVQDVFVHPNCQQHDLGRRLVTTLLDHYPGVRRRVLLTDAEPRQRAFYESLGFTEVHDLRPPLRSFVSFR
ncbi:N-acetyltransferase [Saccharomonospora sp. NB11]|uniref:GNAT family N-acetyltransferase n=1 Tax=Saccharomonospora sp. NB11 TaxID=1642298 RepID=UPI0018D1F384|nr:GNAT family N-acetyltransferase [Saccharomonospora sp. NB11]